MIVELGLKAHHEPGVIRGRRQLRKHGIAWIMGGVKGDIVGGAVGNPIKGEGEPFRSLCTQVKLSDLVVVTTALSRFFFIFIRVAKPRVGRGSLVSRTWVRSPPIAYLFYF